MSRNMDGQVTLALAAALSAILLMIGLGVDVGAALALRTDLDGTAQACAQSALTQANAVKYSADPSAEAIAQVTEVLEENGFSGRATVWYAEAPMAETGASDRWAGTSLTLESEQPAWLLGLIGIPALDVSAGEAWVTHPYSSATVWRPASGTCASSVIEMDSGAVRSRTESPSTWASAPEELRQLVHDAMGG